VSISLVGYNAVCQLLGRGVVEMMVPLLTVEVPSWLALVVSSPQWGGGAEGRPVRMCERRSCVVVPLV